MPISKGEMLISAIAGETGVHESMLMGNTKFVAHAKKTIKRSLGFKKTKETLIKYVNKEY